MLKLIPVIIVLFSVSAHASVVLTRKGLNEECVIKNSLVTKSVKLHQGGLSFVTENKITTKGVEAYAAAALSHATPERANSLGISSHVEVNGEKAALQFDDSAEAGFLIRFLMKACN